MLYLLDANIFIEAKNRYYATDICPGFWDWLDRAFASKDIASISLVCDELISGNDELSGWAKERKSNDWFLEVEDSATQTKFSDISNHVNSAQYKQEAKALFLSGADPWLIAKASILNATIVTHEKPNPHIRAKVPIPNICIPFGVKCLNTFELLQIQSASFVLK